MLITTTENDAHTHASLFFNSHTHQFGHQLLGRQVGAVGEGHQHRAIPRARFKGGQQVHLQAIIRAAHFDAFEGGIVAVDGRGGGRLAKGAPSRDGCAQRGGGAQRRGVPLHGVCMCVTYGGGVRA